MTDTPVTVPASHIDLLERPMKIEDDDAQASFYQSLQKRYGRSYVIPDAPVRVIVTIRPDKVVVHDN
jgi:hypothetical protein